MSDLGIVAVAAEDIAESSRLHGLLAEGDAREMHVTLACAFEKFAHLVRRLEEAAAEPEAKSPRSPCPWCSPAEVTD